MLDVDELPPAVRRVLHAVGEVRDQLPTGDRHGRAEPWSRLGAACEELWTGDLVSDAGARLADAVPAPGAAMLACRCGRAIGVGSMRRLEPIRPAGRLQSGPRIDPIVCPTCALEPTW